MLAIIPVKKNSYRLPNKNIKKFGNYPLFVHTIKMALKSKAVSRVIVSTDSIKIKNIAIKNGAEVPFLRPKKLTKEKITTWEVSKDIIENLQIKENKIYNSFIYLQPTSPLRTDIDINKAIRIFKNKKANAVVSVTESKPNFWFKGITKNGAIINNKLNKMKNYILNGAIYIFKTSYIYKSNSNSYDKKTFAYIMPNERSIDIDTELDFKTAEFVYKKK
jgi:CMP-N,N'-diacetyllegionaminic acid synthase